METMDQQVELVELIVERAIDLSRGGEFGSQYDYSGRGMFGERCPAITGYGWDERYVYMAIGQLIAEGSLPEEASTWFARMDSMGMGWVIY